MAATQMQRIVDPYSAIAFYGIDSSARSARAFFNVAVAWMKRKGIPPDLASLRGEGFSGKTARFATVQSRLGKHGFRHLEGFCLVALRTGGREPIVDDVGSVGWGRRPLYACIDASAAVTSFDEAEMLALSKRCVRALRPAYGIGFTMPHRRCPGLYVGGVNYLSTGTLPVGKEAEEASRVSSWGNIGMPFEVYRDGVLRDVYPWNFLTEPHLARQIEGAVLPEWIEKDPNRGSIEELGEGVWLWRIDEASIPGVRASVWNAGLVFERKNYI